MARKSFELMTLAGIHSHSRQYVKIIYLPRNGVAVRDTRGRLVEWLPFDQYPEVRNLHNGLRWDLDEVHDLVGTLVVPRNQVAVGGLA